MANQSEIKAALERVEKVLIARPETARVTKAATVTWEDGLRFRAEEGDSRITVDMATTMGGEGAGPSPGHLARMALGSCTAIGFAMSFARHEVSFSRLSVRVETDADARGALGMGDAPPGYTQVRCIVEVDTDADSALVETITKEARTNSTVGAAFSEAVHIEYAISRATSRATD